MCDESTKLPDSSRFMKLEEFEHCSDSPGYLCDIVPYTPSKYHVQSSSTIIAIAGTFLFHTEIVRLFILVALALATMRERRPGINLGVNFLQFAPCVSFVMVF